LITQKELRPSFHKEVCLFARSLKAVNVIKRDNQRGVQIVKAHVLFPQSYMSGDSKGLRSFYQDGKYPHSTMTSAIM